MRAFCYFYVLYILLALGAVIGKGSYYTCSDYKKAGHDTSTTYTIFLPSGSYQVYCEMGINGGGYTFISPSMITKLHESDIKYLLNGKKKADDVLLRLSKPDGSQPYTVLKQFTNIGGITVKLHSNEITVNKHLNHNIYIALFEGLAVLRAGMIVNGIPVTYSAAPACGSFSGYFAFYPNEKELKPSTYAADSRSYEDGSIAVDWRSKAKRPYSTRRIPLEYFMLTEMHFGCGTYTTSDRWLTSKYPALGTAIGFR